MGELLDQCGDKDGPATTSVVSPVGGQGDTWCHQWDTDHVTMLDKTSHITGPRLSHLTSQQQHKPLLFPFSLHTSLVGCQLPLGKGRQEPSRKTHPLLSFSPATCPSFRVTSHVMEREEDKSFVIQGTSEMLLRAQRGEGRQTRPLVNMSLSKINNGISAKNIRS